MKLYYSDLSPPCRAVNMVMQYLDVDVEFVEMNLLQGDHLKPEFLKVNPAHTVPTLEDDGFFLYDSHAICTYLASKYGKDDSLYPKNLQVRAKVDEQLHYQNEVFCLFKTINKPVLFKNEKIVSDENKAKLLEVCNILEQKLETHDYIVGNELTVADINHISLLPSFTALIAIPEEEFPRLHAWMSRCSKNIKNYKEANEKGSEELTNIIIQKLNGA